MTHLPWMPVYIGDELAETSHLTAEEFGAYTSLKMHLWQHGRLPNEDERLARIARCGLDRWKIVKDALWSLFANDWRHPRLEALRDEAEETHRKRSEAGKRGGRPRAVEKPGNNPGLSPDKAGPKHPQPQPQPQSHIPSPSQAQPPSPGSALDTEGDTDTRKSMMSPFPIPASPAEGKAFLARHGVPLTEMDTCLKRLLAGDLSPFDIEDIVPERGAA